MPITKHYLRDVTSAVVLYHHPCIDGIFAALAAHSYFKRRNVPCRFVPHRVYEDLDPCTMEVNADDSLYLCDYAGPSSAFAIKLAQRARSVTILDHHKSAFDKFTQLREKHLPQNLDVNFDMARSGCTMALDYFQPSGLTADQQQLFYYAEDADLWRWKLPGSRAFHAGMTSLPKDKYDFDASGDVSIFKRLLALTPLEIITQGDLVLGEQQKAIDEVLQHSFVISLGGLNGKFGRCLAVRADQAKDLRSHIGHALAMKSRDAGLRAMGAVAYIETAMGDDSKIKISLRSFGETEDTTSISVAMGGGGHCNASSFILNMTEFKEWRL